MLVYQLKNAETVPDRAEAAVALGSVRDDPHAVARARRRRAARSLLGSSRRGAARAREDRRTGSGEANTCAGATDDKPWVRDVAVSELGNFKDDASLPPKAEHHRRERSGISRARVRARRAGENSKRRMRSKRSTPR